MDLFYRLSHSGDLKTGTSVYPPKPLATNGQCWDWFVLCQHTVSGYARKFNLHLRSLHGGTEICMSRSVSEILWHVAWTFSHQTNNNKCSKSCHCSHFPCHRLTAFFLLLINYRLVGQVVKVSASRAEEPGFQFRLRREFFGDKSYL